MENYLDSLNHAQKEAVTETEGPVLVVAGAGAGKTKTITYRILHLIKTGVSPEKILAITFTNKAAREMSERVQKLLFEDSKINLPIGQFGNPDIRTPRFQSTNYPWLGTFHSLGVKILRENWKEAGISASFSIFDRGDSIKLIKEAMKTKGIDPKSIEPSKILGVISREKGNMITAGEFADRNENSYFGKLAGLIWFEYEKLLAKEKALDFDDLLLKTANLLKKNEDVRSKYQNLWQYIHVDEYQDTNEVQYKMVRLLVGDKKNICVVGDGDQLIYGWRGADIKNILDFEKDYPDAKVVLLEQNYRSTQTILTVANRIISKNKMRKDKNLFTKNSEGEKIGLYTAYDEADEAYFVAEKTAELIKGGTKPSEIAVLYRANFQSRALEEAFLKEMIVHHEGAVDMAKVLGQGGVRPELATFGAAIIDVQSKEIDMMKGWLKEWFNKEI
jgi:DNA helicase-2/ATP-dependent DNA helicase PcrA